MMYTERQYPFILTCFVCALIISGNGTTFARTRRTLPLDFSALNGLWNVPRKAANTVVRLLSAPEPRNPINVEFRPGDGIRASCAYQQRYGYRGERLIESLGLGFPLNSDPRLPPVPAIGLTPPLPLSSFCVNR